MEALQHSIFGADTHVSNKILDYMDIISNRTRQMTIFLYQRYYKQEYVPWKTAQKNPSSFQGSPWTVQLSSKLTKT